MCDERRPEWSGEMRSGEKLEASALGVAAIDHDVGAGDP